MTNAKARKIFDEQIAAEVNADRIAKLELMREYFTNADFRAAMHNEVARLNGIA